MVYLSSNRPVWTSGLLHIKSRLEGSTGEITATAAPGKQYLLELIDNTVHI